MKDAPEIGDREVCPIVFLRGSGRDEIVVEVAFAEFEYSGPGTASGGVLDWTLIQGTGDVQLPEDASRVVLELPTGCFEVAAPGPMRKEMTMRVAPSGKEGAARVRPCDRTMHAMAQAAIEGR